MKKDSLQNKRHRLRRAKTEEKKRQRTPSLIVITRPNAINSTLNRAPVSWVQKRAPERFLLQAEYCEEVVNYIDEIKTLGNSGSNINIVLEDVIEIGEGAIAMLLSVMEELTQRKVSLRGTKPKNKVARDILEKSGFFKHMNGYINAENKVTKNTILRTGGKIVKKAWISKEIRSANETVWGEVGRNPPLRGTVFEMMRNSCDHAFSPESNICWHFAISHDELESLVKFSFVDNGRGIIKSFKSGLLKKVLHAFTDNNDILETAFKNGLESRTGLSWRGKGLPTIFENYEDGYITNLVVISNDVFIDFDRKISKTLPVPFNGTYYFWMLTKKCVKACFKDE